MLHRDGAFMASIFAEVRMTNMKNEVVDAFKATLRGPVLQPGDPGYDDARAIWNAMIDKRPGLIVRCAGTADVVLAVNFARENGLPLAVRGGGHNIAGSALCDDGMVIDLSGMRDVHVDPRARWPGSAAARCCPTSTTRPSPAGWRSRWASTRPPGRAA
jgi:hypothetical protein